MTHSQPKRAATVAVPRAGLSDDTFFSHSLREQDLAKGIVDFVRAGVEQIFAL